MSLYYMIQVSLIWLHVNSTSISPNRPSMLIFRQNSIFSPKYHQVRVNMNISSYKKSFFQTMILGQFNKMIICFSCALRFIFLIGYASFNQYCLYLVKVWNNKSFLKPTFSIYAHFVFSSFLFCFVLFFYFQIFLQIFTAQILYFPSRHSCFIILAYFLVVNLHIFV